MRYFIIFSSIGLCLFIISCNMLSPKNVSNDFRWKNRKFKEPVELALQYNPEIIINIPKVDIPWFYKHTDTVDADKNYRIRELLENKFAKRNMIFNPTSPIKVRIDTLLFKEYAEVVSVNGEAGYIGESTKDYFVFEISGAIIKNDTVFSLVAVKHEYNNEPRESHVIDNIIVMGGGAARADKMIENSINMFSYKVYRILTEPEKYMIPPH